MVWYCDGGSFTGVVLMQLQAFISRGQCIWRAAMDDLIAQGQLTIVHPCCSKFLPLCVQIYIKIRHGRTWKLEVAMVN
ncbi:hypothetical protein SORBI_3005G159801 [Sorghum bicolor]|uniref:Uncharacterized protein n=1 Tax=Sorghum bicolor TaxID=4558 RepID=A0A1Z5RIS4_SORBI|nr:hypothetical protein SORBI_3005G159801 [Sorghum bicolor]